MSGNLKQALASRVVTLNNGTRPHTAVTMPLYGSGLSHNGGFSGDAVRDALAIGVRLFDTAERYGTEEALAAVVSQHQRQQTDPDDDHVFITTKFWPGSIGRTASRGGGGGGGGPVEDVFAAADESLKRLGRSNKPIDLFLLHWPSTLGGSIPPSYLRCGITTPTALRRALWIAMEELLLAGKCRAIGVSNFEVRHLRDIVLPTEQPPYTPRFLPALNQVELHPFCQNREIRAFCQSHGIVVGGYCPLAKTHALASPVVVAEASRLGITPAGLLLRWSLDHCGCVTIPKSTNVVRQRENAEMTLLTMPQQQKDAAVMLQDAFRKLDAVSEEFRATWDPRGVE